MLHFSGYKSVFYILKVKNGCELKYGQKKTDGWIEMISFLFYFFLKGEQIQDILCPLLNHFPRVLTAFNKL